MPTVARDQRFGPYELVTYFAAGGMADLYIARRADYDGDLILKKIQTRYLDYTKVVKMFVDEGRIAQALDHPNIVKVVDVGQVDGTYFIAMEYIRGHDLLAVCRRGVEVGNFLPRHLAVAILVQALRGLQHAHEKVGPDGQPLRVVHCDISPGNIVLGWGGTAKIVDFGISRATIQLRAEDHSVAGKYNYMAPEQIKGEPVDARADIFAIGILLYELTTGKRLFRGRPEQVMRLVVEEPIARPTDVRADYPPALERVVMRALERDPNARYQTARAMRDELMIWLAEAGLPHGKRQLAIYLREAFGSEKTQESEEFGTAEGDAELILEKSLPTTASGVRQLPLEVDPEEPENTTGAHIALPEVRRPTTTPTPTPAPIVEAAPPPQPGFHLRPVALVAIAVVIALILYFLLAG
jgi:serine/threonine-protein kinase